MMKLPKVVIRSAFAAFALFTCSLLFSSCHREACPGQITDIEMQEQGPEQSPLISESES